MNGKPRSNSKSPKQLGQHSRRFASMPSESDWSIPFLESVSATSSIGDETENGTWRISPKAIPIKGFALWMYSCSFVIFPLIIFFVAEPQARWIGIGLSIAGGFIIVPAMMAMFYYANQEVGTEDYLRFDEKECTFELPRLQVSFLADQVCEVASIRFDQVVQTLLLVQETNRSGEAAPQWTLYRVCDICDSKDWLGKKLAKLLNLQCRSYRYSGKEYRELIRNS